MKELIKRGANVEAEDDKGYTALKLACIYRDYIYFDQVVFLARAEYLMNEEERIRWTMKKKKDEEEEKKKKKDEEEKKDKEEEKKKKDEEG